MARLKVLKIHTFDSLQVRKILKSIHWIFFNVKDVIFALVINRIPYKTRRLDGQSYEPARMVLTL